MKTFFKVWIDPRGVVRSKIGDEHDEQPMAKYIVLTFLLGVLLLTGQNEIQLGRNLGQEILLIVFIALFIGILTLYAMPPLIKLIGRLVSGKGSTEAVRIAIVYTQTIPTIVINALAVIGVATLGSQFIDFRNGFDGTLPALPEPLAVIALLIAILIAVLSIWQIVIALHGFGEALGISALGALLMNIILGFILTGLILLIVPFLLLI
ncbi:hypothetical protein JOC54_002703 [Alkalihalobacillus xiaoxiensis]|uniref:Yip1 domain-containing protein n=1 Tax=Shouchella xiaoxiensis TaxID=766895 RepID=A0ABS2SV52_9BACI|nr:YIP1 family protein [Shouchella xiaoxiensis]MBM7839423.1 hypothetical protein [Shouchella xiaoxiensis]